MATTTIRLTPELRGRVAAAAEQAGVTPKAAEARPLTVTRNELAPVTEADFDRSIDHRNEFDMVDPADRIPGIIQASDVLQHDPLMSRHARDGRRELVIGRRAPGCAALNEYVEPVDPVFVLAAHTQSEAGDADE